MTDELIAYEVDMQNDFMNEKNGRLYVPDAEKIKPKIAYVADMMIKNNIRRIRGRDRHFADDPEMIENGGPFPQHCMDKMYGQKNEDGAFGIDFIPELKAADAFVLENKTEVGNKIRTYTEKELREIANEKKDIVFDKQHYDVFTNHAAEKVLEYMNVKRAIVYGVATEYCDLAFVLGAQKRNIQTYVLTDAIKPITQDGAKDALVKMQNAGAKFVETKNLEQLLW